MHAILPFYSREVFPSDAITRPFTSFLWSEERVEYMYSNTPMGPRDSSGALCHQLGLTSDSLPSIHFEKRGEVRSLRKFSEKRAVIVHAMETCIEMKEIKIANLSG